MPKIVIDLPIDYAEIIAQVCSQEELTQTEFFIEAVKAFLLTKGLYPGRTVDKTARVRAVEIQDMLAASDTDCESDSVQEIVEWRRSLVSRE